MILLALTLAAMVQTAAPPPQTVPAEAAPAVAPAPAPVPEGPAWKAFSASSIRAYLLDMHQIKRDGDVAGVVVAQVPLDVADPATDHSYRLIDIEVQCTTHQSRVIAETPFDATGTAEDREEIGETFGPYAPGGMDNAVANLLCNEQEPEGTAWPTVTAFIDNGRK